MQVLSLGEKWRQYLQLMEITGSDRIIRKLICIQNTTQITVTCESKHLFLTVFCD